MSISKRNTYSSHSLHVIPVLVLLWFFKNALSRVFLCYLTLFSKAHSFKSQPKTTRLSICITLMCMMISCYCTYCLQEGFINMKAHLSTISSALMHRAKMHVTHCLLCHAMHSHISIFSLHECIYVGGGYACYMSFQSFVH